VSVRARALLGAGSLANYQSDYMRAGALLSESLSLHRQLDDKQGTAYCLNLLSHAMTMTGELDEADQYLQESLSIFRELGDTRGIGYALYFMGSMYIARDDPAAARPVLEESVMHLQKAGDKWWVGNALLQLGWTINRQGEHARALKLFDEALAISDHFGDMRGTARAQLYIAETKFSQGQYDAAKGKYQEALVLFDDIGDLWWATVCLEGLAYIAAHEDDAVRAARLLGAAEHMHELLAAPLLAVYREGNERCTNRAREQLTPEEFSRAWNEGRAMTHDEAIELAMSE
jgi:tetratricopeptide (TPR) repeat protein